MKMMQGFMSKMGGEQNCQKANQEFFQAMQSTGTEHEKKQQWEKFG